MADWTAEAWGVAVVCVIFWSMLLGIAAEQKF